MFVYGADFFVFRPGWVLLVVGLLLTLPLTFGPIALGPVTFSLYWMLAGFAATLLGLQGVYMGCIARIFYDFTGSARRRLLAFFPYTRTVLLSAVLFVAGLGLTTPLIRLYLRGGLRLPVDPGIASHMAVTGLLLCLSGFITFVFMLLVHAASRLSNLVYGASGASPGATPGGLLEQLRLLLISPRPRPSWTRWTPAS